LKILNEDLKHGTVAVEINNLSDLWNLYNIIERDDQVYAKTSREIKRVDTSRPSSERVTVNVWLKVIKTSFDRQLNRLRIHGVIVQAPEKYALQGSHHTVSLAPDSQLTIQKGQWFKHQLERLRKTVREEKPFAILSLDADEACFALIQSFGVDVKAEIRSRLAGKNDAGAREESLTKYFAEVVRMLKTSLDNTESGVIIVGPGFLKDRFTKYLAQKDRELASRVAAVKSVGNGGRGGVYEALRSGLIGAVVRKSRLCEEMAKVEEVFTKLSQAKGDVSYGVGDVEGDAEAAAVAALLVSVDLLKRESLEERMRVEEIIRSVEESGGEVVVVSSEHEGGAKLSSLGGVAAILRYPRHAWESPEKK